MGKVKQETIPDIPAKEEHEVLIVFTQTYAKNFSAHSYQEATEMAEKEYEMGIMPKTSQHTHIKKQQRWQKKNMKWV